MNADGIQALILRPAVGPAVRHLVLRVVPGGGGVALAQLQRMLSDAPLATGPGEVSTPVHCTLGFSFLGLRMLSLPEAYLRVFSRLAPAFAIGAPLRAGRVGDGGASAPTHWRDGFRLDQAHVVVTLHGAAHVLDALVARWRSGLLISSADQVQAGLLLVDELRGQRLGAPPGRHGEWVHFGYRDGLTDHVIAGIGQPRAPDTASPLTLTPQAAGEFLLGRSDNNGTNRFALTTAPDEVRAFFHDSSFGVLRPMAQDTALFEATVRRWAAEAQAHLGHVVSEDWVRAKLCGRWPSGEVLRPGQFVPRRDDYRTDFPADPDGTGCPWFAHVRRMDPRGHRPADRRPRPLLRRGIPYGPATWDAVADGDVSVDRGLLGLFFCADIEAQFEELVGAWANDGPPGAPRGRQAHDPLAGWHDDPFARLQMPLPGALPLTLRGLAPWTRTVGCLYAWYPTRAACQRLLAEDYVPAEESEPWL